MNRRTQSRLFLGVEVVEEGEVHVIMRTLHCPGEGGEVDNKTAEFVDEHKANADPWDLRRLFLAWRDSVSFVIAGSDPLEHNQIVKTRERLGEYGIDVRVFPGGHFATSEQPELFAQMIQELHPT